MRCGQFRCAFYLGNIVIKVPRLTQLAKGIICNRWEKEVWVVWRPIFSWKHLCPVIALDPFGIFLLMYKAEQPVSQEEIDEADDEVYPNIEIECKPENWGRIKNKIVCLDYGIETKELVDKQREYLESKRTGFSNT